MIGLLTRAFALISFVLASPVMASDRIALVIGNGSYSAAPSLKNPTNDANLIGDALENVGFTVTRAFDLSQIDMIAALGAFSREAAKADTAVVYFAGHGIEINRTNYLIPVDARLEFAADADFQAVQLDLMIRSVAGARTLGIVVVDACRNNPFAIRLDQSGRGVVAGMGRVEPLGNTLVAYSAREGTVALDGVGDNSPYAIALGHAIVTPGLEIGKLFRTVRDDVMATTGGTQEPVLFGTLSARDYFLLPGDGNTAQSVDVAAAQPVVPDKTAVTMQVELAFWEAAELGGTEVEYRIYLDRYPDGVFAPMARQRIAALARRDKSGATGSETEVAALEPAADGGHAVRNQLGSAGLAEPQPESGGSDTPAARSDRISSRDDGPGAKAGDQGGGQSGGQGGGQSGGGAAVENIGGGKAGSSGGSDRSEAEMAAMAPPKPVPPAVLAPPVEPALTQVDVVRGIQQELNRVGCSVGTADGIWGPASQRGLTRFREISPMLDELPDSPSGQMLAALRVVRGTVCGPECGAAEVIFNGQCVPKTCPQGQTLSSKGNCYAPKPEQPRVSGNRTESPAVPAPAARKEPKAPAAGGAGCIMFNGKWTC